MMNNMFCFQCEQTAGGCGCTGKAGVCGKPADVANIQDALTKELIGLACAGGRKEPSPEAVRIMLEGLFATITNVNFDGASLKTFIDRAGAERRKADPLIHLDCEESQVPLKLWSADEDIRSLKSLILFGLRGMAAYAYHALVLGYSDDEVNKMLFTGLAAVGNPDATMDDLLPVVMDVGTCESQMYGASRPRQYGDVRHACADNRAADHRKGAFHRHHRPRPL
jgi:hydroxylamine reductase